MNADLTDLCGFKSVLIRQIRVNPRAISFNFVSFTTLADNMNNSLENLFDQNDFTK